MPRAQARHPHEWKERTMRLRILGILLAIPASTGLLAQGLYLNADKPDDPICSRIERDKTSLNYGTGATAGGTTTSGMAGANTSGIRYYQSGTRYFAPGERPDVSAFAAANEKGQEMPLAALKGKVVVVGLWSVHCQPSAKMLLELADMLPKRDKFGFEVFAVNVDQNRELAGGGTSTWPDINKFRVQNAAFFKNQMPVYLPGLGKAGLSNFMTMVQSVPVLILVDRTGHMASLQIGYEPNFVAMHLSRILREGPGTPVPGTTVKPVETTGGGGHR